MMGQKYLLCMTLAATLMTRGALNPGGEFTAVTVAANGPGYVALGDSVEFGLGDDIAADGIGSVDPFGAWLSTMLAVPVTVTNFGEVGAYAARDWQAPHDAAFEDGCVDVKIGAFPTTERTTLVQARPARMPQNRLS